MKTMERLGKTLEYLKILEKELPHNQIWNDVNHIQELYNRQLKYENTIKCPECRGSGNIKISLENDGCGFSSDWITCDKCSGEGRIKDEN